MHQKKQSLRCVGHKVGSRINIHTCIHMYARVPIASTHTQTSSIVVYILYMLCCIYSSSTCDVQSCARQTHMHAPKTIASKDASVRLDIEIREWQQRGRGRAKHLDRDIYKYIHSLTVMVKGFECTIVGLRNHKKGCGLCVQCYTSEMKNWVLYQFRTAHAQFGSRMQLVSSSKYQSESK